MIVTKEGKEEGVVRMKRLSFALLIAIMSVLFSAVYAAALSSSDLAESDKEAALAKAEGLWEGRTSDANITFRLTPEGILWTVAANEANGFNLYAEGIGEEVYSYMEREAIPMEEALASDKIPQSWKTQILEDLAKLQKKIEEKTAAGVQSSGGDSGFSGFTEEEKANAIPAPRPEGIDTGANSEDIGEESSSMPAKDKQEAAKAPQSGTESVESSPNAAAQAASSEIASTATAAGAKEPEEAMKDKSGEKTEPFFVKVLKWLFGK